MKAMLIDSTRCLGCRGCQVACKQWNGLEGEETSFLPSQKAVAPEFARRGYQNPRDLSAKTWTLLTFNEVELGGRLQWVFGKQQCMHCGLDAEDRDKWPACVVSCPVQALEKTKEGPVIWHTERCIGCRYCMLACPFHIPKFEWDKAWPRIRKCTMCFDRLKQGKEGFTEPACSKTCPTDAIVWGERDELLAEAHRRLEENPGKYYQHIYGEHEVGGTCVLHLSSVPFEQLHYPTNLPDEPLAVNTSRAMKAPPYVIVGLSLGMIGVYSARRRKIESEAKEREGSGHE
jgi:formate dehydrogenase iron-sulfur subunit